MYQWVIATVNSQVKIEKLQVKTKNSFSVSTSRFLQRDKCYFPPVTLMLRLFARILIYLSLRDITVEQQSISPLVTANGWAASQCPWSTPPCCWIYGRRAWRNWPSSLLTRTTRGRTTTSSCSPSPAELRVCGFLLLCRSETQHSLIHYLMRWLVDFWCCSEIQMYLCNKERYGYLNVPGKPHHTLEDDRLNFVHLHLESISIHYSFIISTMGNNRGKQTSNWCTGTKSIETKHEFQQGVFAIEMAWKVKKII